MTTSMKNRTIFSLFVVNPIDHISAAKAGPNLRIVPGATSTSTASDNFDSVCPTEKHRKVLLWIPVISVPLCGNR